MAPVLRSSAPNTPTGRSNTASETSTVTPRKTPQCTKCKRPRAGHPRSGCPYIDSPLKGKDVQVLPVTTKNITDALGSMSIDALPTRERDEDTKATIIDSHRSLGGIVPAESLMSPSTNSQKIVERLLQPRLSNDGDTDDDKAPDTKERTKIVRWQETLILTPEKTKPRIKMPGSLSTPSPYSSLDSTNDSKDKIVAPDSPGSGPSQPSYPQPLMRSMSMEQREDFVSSLSTVSDAMIYVIPSADIRNIQASAIKLGFHTKILVSRDDSDPQGLLILGRDEKAVQKLFMKVERESTKTSNVPTGRLRAAAGGAVVGAVGAWAGLAFA